MNVFDYLPLLILVACAILACLGYLYYYLLLRHHLAEYAAAIDKDALVNDADGAWQRLLARLKGWYTVILASIAAVVQAVPAMLDSYLPTLRDAPWAQVIDQKVASWISFVCVVLIPLVHVRALAHAAQTPPADPADSRFP